MKQKLPGSLGKKKRERERRREGLQINVILQEYFVKINRLRNPKLD
jgi:hypothetical protein